MADFPYTNNPASLKKFLEHVQAAGVPPKVTIQYLESVGFKSTNDRPILRVLKDLGFVSSSGEPTELWQRYRNKAQARSIMAEMLTATYDGLFSTYPDAYQKDNEALRNYFSTHSKVGEDTVTLIVRTFKALCEMSDFDAPSAKADNAPAKPAKEIPSSTSAKTMPLPSTSAMVVNLNIQLTLPATEDAEIY